MLSDDTRKKVELVCLCEKVISISASATYEFEFREAFDEVFSDDCSKRIFGLCVEVFGDTFDNITHWYDPDTSYEEDVIYFAKAVETLLERVLD